MDNRGEREVRVVDCQGSGIDMSDSGLFDTPDSKMGLTGRPLQEFPDPAPLENMDQPRLFPCVIKRAE